MIEPLESRRLLTYLLPGDFDFSGNVDGNDYAIIDSNVGTGTLYHQGDANSDGAINGDDYHAIDSHNGLTLADVTGYKGTLMPSGSFTVTQDNAVIENLDVRGPINVNADNVTIRNFRIDALGAPYAIKLNDNNRGLVVEWGEITNAAGGAIYQQGYTARRLNVHHMGSDGFKAGGYGNVTVEYSWVHHLGMNEGSHADGVQVIGGPNHTFRANVFDMPINQTGFASNATLFISYISGQLPMSNVLIENNWLNGGNYTVKINDSVTARDNYFGRDFRYGIKYGSEAHLAVWEENRFADTGELIP